MGKTRAKDRKIPPWATLDNTDDTNTFAQLHQSLILSEAFQSLTAEEKVFLFVLFVNNYDPDNASRVAKFKREENKRMGLPDDTDVKFWTDWNSGYFIFSPQEQAKYGYNRSKTSRCMNALIKAGFIRRVRDNRYETPDRQTREQGYHLCNVYQMSCDWKRREQKE